MIDTDRQTLALFALLAPFAASAAAAESEMPHKMPELGKGTPRGEVDGYHALAETTST